MVSTEEQCIEISYTMIGNTETYERVLLAKEKNIWIGQPYQLYMYWMLTFLAHPVHTINW